MCQSVVKGKPEAWASGRLLEALREGQVHIGLRCFISPPSTPALPGIRYDVQSYGTGSLDFDLVVAWQALCHDTDSNKCLGLQKSCPDQEIRCLLVTAARVLDFRYQATSLETKIQVCLSMKNRVPGGDWDEVKKELAKIYGSGKRITIGRLPPWCQMVCGICGLSKTQSERQIMPGGLRWPKRLSPRMRRSWAFFELRPLAEIDYGVISGMVYVAQSRTLCPEAPQSVAPWLRHGQQVFRWPKH